MDKIKYRISLDMHSSVSQASLAAKQGDDNRQFSITLRSGGQPYEIERGAFAVFSTTLPDGKVIEDNCIIVDDEIIYDFTQNLTSQVGVLDIEIRLYGHDSSLITSPTFILVVSPRAAKAEEIESSDSFKALDGLYNKTNTLYEDTSALYEELADKTGNFVVDKTYIPSSSFAQSGTAVSEAVSGAANSIMTRKSGERVDLYDLSPLSDAFEVRATLPSGVNAATAYAFGKNIAKVNKVTYPTSEVIIFEGDITGDFVLSLTNNVTGVEALGGAMIKYTLDGVTKHFTSYALSSLEVGFNTNKAVQKISGKLTYMSFINNGKATGGSFDDIQLELGKEKTEFEEFKGFYTIPITNDTGDTVRISSSKATFVSNTEGVVLDIGYSPDTKRFVDESQSSIKASLEKANLPISSDILERVYGFKYYTSLANAISGAETDKFRAKVGGYTDGNGSRHLVVLDDLTESANITIASDVSINLNGKTVSLGSNAQFNVEANVTIDGKMPHSIIEKIVATSSVAERIFRVNSGTLTTYGGLFKTEVSQAGKPCIVFHNTGGVLECNDGKVYVEAEGSAAQIACLVNAKNATLNNCKFEASSALVQSIAISNTGDITINESSILADGANDGSIIHGVGAFNDVGGVMRINRSNVCAPFGGVQNNGTLYIDGGEYSGVGHGGLYLVGGSTSYIEDAKLKTVGYSGKYKARYNYTYQYRSAGFYLGGTDVGGTAAYFDNCEISNDEKDKFLFALTSTPNAISNVYMSGCTVKGDGVIRVSSNMYRLHLGLHNNFDANNTNLSDEDKAIVVISTSGVYSPDIITG